MRVVEDGGKCLTACNASKQFNKSETSKAELGKSCAKLKDSLNDLDKAVEKTNQNPASALYQTEMLSKIKKTDTEHPFLIGLNYLHSNY